MVKVAAIQPRPVGDELRHPKNVQHAIELLKRYVRANEEVRIACFPEYFPWYGEAELAKEARELGIYIIAGIAEEQEGVLYNSCVLFGPDGSIVGRQRKLNLGLMERRDFGFSPGRELRVFDTDIGRIGIGVCVDFWGPPNVGRELVEMGAEIIFNPSFFFIFREIWRCLLLARAVELMVPIVAVDTAQFPFRLGDKVFKRCGGLSCIIGPPWRSEEEFLAWWREPRFNWVLGQLGLEEGVLIRDIDLDLAKRCRAIWRYRLLGEGETGE